MTEERVKFLNLSDSALRADIEIKASPERVYAAWTNVEELVKWFGPPNGKGRLHVDRFDCTVGGNYDVTMVFDDGDRVQLTGSYKELDPFNRIVLTWTWAEGPMSSQETLVTVDLSPTPQGTHLTLVHERFATLEGRDAHHEGWGPVLDRLASVLSQP